MGTQNQMAVFHQLIKIYATPDLEHLSKEQLITELVWMRYLHDFRVENYTRQRKLGGIKKGTKQGEQESKYEVQRRVIKEVIFARVSKKMKVRKSFIESDLAKRDDITQYQIDKVWSQWLREGIKMFDS
jgi:hypothetical protein